MPKYDTKTMSKVLNGTELIDYLCSGKEPKDLEIRIARQNAKTPEGKRALKSLRLGLIPEMPKGDTWENLALVMPIQRSICKCGCRWEAPCGKPMVKAKHQTKGIHIKQANPDLLYDELPREFYYLQEEINCCPQCFGAEATVGTNELPHH